MSLTPNIQYSFKKYLLLGIYLFVFFFCILNEPIYSPDTYSYLRAMPYRNMGYVIFLKGFSFVFKSYFDLAVIIFHSVFSLFSVYYFISKISPIFKLSNFQQLLLLIILLFPFFPPLSIANNIASEGLGYGLYLLFITVGTTFLFTQKSNYIKYFILLYLLLVAVRGQFIFTTLIFTGTYFLKYRHTISQRKHILNIVILVGVIFLASLTERSYHRLKDGFFKPTPLGFISASTAPIYLSDSSDYRFINNKDLQSIFKISYDSLMSKDLLIKPESSIKEAYLDFHSNFPKICNQTVMEVSKFYFSKRPIPKNWTENQSNSHIYFETESACKKLTKILIFSNYKKWSQMFYQNITHGFRTQILLWFVVLMFLYSFVKSFWNYQKTYGIIFLLSSLILSNALFIAFASHSIQRYLFYNYALIFLLFLSTYNVLIRGSKS